MTSSVEPDKASEISDCVLQILAGSDTDRVQAAHHLMELGVTTRGSVRPRGTLHTAAANRLPDRRQLTALIACLDEVQGELRCELVSALGEWGDEEAVVAISKILRSDADEKVQRYCVSALDTIGGPAASESLRWAAEHGTESVRMVAIWGIRELETGGALDYSEGHGAIRVEGL